MVAPMLDERDLDCMLYELFDAAALTSRERYADHNRETFSAAINTAITVAEKYFLPFRQKVDTHQPTFDGEKVHIIAEIKTALDAVVEAGLASGACSGDGYTTQRDASTGGSNDDQGY